MTNDPPLKLTIELVPEPCWYKSLREATTRTQWDKLRRQVYTEHGNRCAICDAEGMLYCHEIWEYDDDAHVQRLAGFTALCPMCSHVKHIGLAGKLAQQGKLDYEAVVAHFLGVNNCTRAAFNAHHTAAFDQWRKRSHHTWTTDLGEYRSLVEPRS